MSGFGPRGKLLPRAYWEAKDSKDDLRVPYAPAFREFAEIGAALMQIHIHYEQQPEYPLDRKETGKLNWRVEKMSLSKDKPNSNTTTSSPSVESHPKSTNTNSASFAHLRRVGVT